MLKIITKRGKMKFLVVGLGSMGKRRVRNLQYLKAGEIIGFDLRKERCREAREKYNIKTFARFKEAMAENPDVFIISVPSNLHHHYAMIAAQHNKHFFTESNFLPQGIDDLINVEKKKNIVAVPSFTMPHHPSVKLMKKFTEENKIGKILSFTYHLGAYLPAWHPWEDYRKVYFSKKETPGSKEMVACELTWIVWMLGNVKRVSTFKGKLSNLETAIDDVYQIILEFKNGILGNMLIDIVSQPSEREMRLIGEKGTIHWYSEKDLIKVFDAKKNKWKSYIKKEKISQPGYSVKTHEEMYVEEIEDFIKAIKGRQNYPYTFSQEKNIINILRAIEKSAEKFA